jgi:2,4-dienoyl-CoA reductase-like NADH-dependent reductase (Old Yellow Enzyme family)
MTDVIEILEAIRTELDCDRLDGARVALLDYWTNRDEGNGTKETDEQAKALAKEISELADAIAGGI